MISSTNDNDSLGDVVKMKRYIVGAFKECVKSVLPRNIVRNSLRFDSKTLHVRDDRFPVSGDVHVVGFGKAVLDMALEIEKMLTESGGGGPSLKSAVLSVPHGTAGRHGARNSKIRALQAAENNVPDRQAVENTDRIKKAIDDVNDDDVLIVLISGGGSALLCSPTVPLPDKITAIRSLSSGGATIEQLNAVRTALSTVKGGRLIGPERKFTAISLILSDVVGDPPGAIASGPTVPPDPNDRRRQPPMDIIRRFGLDRELPESVLKSLQRYRPSRADAVKKVHNYIIGNNALALRTAVEHVRNDYTAVPLTGSLQGDVTVVSKFYCALIEFVCKLYATNGGTTNDDLTALKNRLASDIDGVDGAIDVDQLTNKVIEATSNKRGLCFVSGGEPTVRVQGSGLGGRNQELALRVSVGLSDRRDLFDCAKPCDVMFFSGGTDGIDGPTDACGAFGYLGLVETALSQGLNPSRYLEINDSYGFYSSFNDGVDLLKTGHTGTNVMDVHLLIVKPK